MVLSESEITEIFITNANVGTAKKDDNGLYEPIICKRFVSFIGNN